MLRWFQWTSLFLLGLIAGCAPVAQPDLTRLYRSTLSNVDQPPVILIHGILGAKLRTPDDGEEIWIGPLSKLLFSDYRDLALKIDPDTLEPLPGDDDPFAITDEAAGVDFYGRIVAMLEQAGGYTRGAPGQAVEVGGRRYYLFLYDWRQDNVASAARLNDLIEQIRVDYADPTLKVDIVAHSMGGLVTRYFLRYGTQDVLDDNEFPVNLWGKSRVRRVILLGTPNLGSVNALHAFIEGIKVAFGRIPTEVLATMPSVYQLFPHPIAGDWVVTTSGKSLQRDLFEVDIWRRFQWSIFDPEVELRIMKTFDEPEQGRAYLQTLGDYFEKQLERARRFVWSLTVKLDETPWQLIVFGGDCELTASRLVVEEVDGKSTIRLRPRDIKRPETGIDYEDIMLAPGDGTVSKASLLARNSLDPRVPRNPYVFFPIDYSMFICESHDQLTGNTTFQDNLLHVLLSR